MKRTNIVSDTDFQAIEALDDLGAAHDRLHTYKESKQAFISLMNKYHLKPQRICWLETEIPPQVRNDYYDSLDSKGDTSVSRRKRRGRITKKLRGLAREIRNDPYSNDVCFTDGHILQALYGAMPRGKRGDIKPNLLSLRHRSDCNKPDPDYAPTLGMYLSVVADMYERGDMIRKTPHTQKKQTRVILSSAVRTIYRLIHSNALRDYFGPPVPEGNNCCDEIAKIVTALLDLENPLTSDHVSHHLND